MNAAARPERFDDTRSGFLPERIVHLHPTRLCNLACAHCYSESDPRQRAALEPGPLIAALSVLRAEGYRLLSLSGGEPLVYPHLLPVVVAAKKQGFRVTMISNGLLVQERNDALLDLLDGIAISFDGDEATHNALRGRADAFQRATKAVQHLAARGQPVAAAISLTRDAIPELPELADQLVNLGAKALQIRPVARAGRAKGLDASTFFSASDEVRLYLVVLALREELPEGVRLHCDLAPAQGLWNQRDDYGGLLGDCTAQPLTQRPLAELVNPLVITEAGTLKPVAYDFAPGYDVGSIDGCDAMTLARYKDEGLPALQQLIGRTLAGLQARPGLVDWFDHLARASEAHLPRYAPGTMPAPKPLFAPGLAPLCRTEIKVEIKRPQRQNARAA